MCLIYFRFEPTKTRLMEPHFWHEYYDTRSTILPPAIPAPILSSSDPSDYTVLMQTEDGARTTERPIRGATTALEALRQGRRLLLASNYYVGVVRYRGEPLCGWPVVK